MSEDLNVDFSRLTIADVERLVGKKADSVQIWNNWVRLCFDGVYVQFRKW